MWYHYDNFIIEDELETAWQFIHRDWHAERSLLEGEVSGSLVAFEQFCTVLHAFVQFCMLSCAIAQFWKLSCATSQFHMLFCVYIPVLHCFDSFYVKSCAFMLLLAFAGFCSVMHSFGRVYKIWPAVVFSEHLA
jgi:hypothetical protein